ncbi:MAG: hypothetical protein ABI780_03770 [Ardenticatenales bacterium]
MTQGFYGLRIGAASSPAVLPAAAAHLPPIVTSQAGALTSPPADLRVHMAAGHTDAQLFYWITNGIEATGMPAFGGPLTTSERWQVIDFIRTFAEP